MAARHTTPLEVAWAIDISNKLLPAGDVQVRDQKIVVEAGDLIHSAGELRKLVIIVVDGVPYILEMSHVSSMVLASLLVAPGLVLARPLIGSSRIPIFTRPWPYSSPKKRCQCRLGEIGPEDRIEVISGLTTGETVLIASQ